jgi:Mce-associated membrane protein
VRLLLAGVVVMATLGAFALYDRGRMGDDQAAARECLAIAPAAAAALFSYDYRTFDASVANGRSFAAGTFADEYAQTTAALKAAAEKEQAVVTAQANSAGVVSAGGDQVEVLVYLNQYRRNVNITGEKVDQNRVVLTMTRVDGRWKVTGAQAI